MKYKFEHPTERVLIFLIVAIIALLAAILWVYGQKLDILWNDKEPAANEQKVAPDFRQAIQSAQRSLFNPGVVDAAANRVYFPGLNFYVPLTEKSQTLMYNRPLGDSSPTEAIISANSIVNAYMNDYSEISCMARPAGVTINKDSDTWKKANEAGTVQLGDSRTMHIYKNTAKNCKSIFAYVSPDDITSILKQAKSY